jgi:hypothetical protein
MGIQNFISWVSHTYPGSINKPNKHVYDYIYVDVNHILHISINESRNQESFFNNVRTNLNGIFFKFIGRKIILAIDGSPPYAKIILQKKRRKMPEKLNEKNKLSSLHLTCGTDLISNLGDFLNTYMKNIKNQYKYIDLSYQIITANEPDEAEIKIFYNLRNNCINQDSEHSCLYSHLIVGNDADLILLSVSSKYTTNIDLLIRYDNSLRIISINKLLSAHKTLMLSSNIFSGYKLDIESNLLKYDFCLISVLIGNDYLPKLSYVKFDILWESYKKYIHFYKRPITKNMKISLKSFINYIDILLVCLDKKYTKMSLDKYNEPDIENYLDGLVWCFNMYCDSKCHMYDYCSYFVSPKPRELQFYINKIKNLPNPQTDKKPLSSDECLILLIPNDKHDIIPVRLSKIIKNKKYIKLMEQEIQPCNFSEYINDLSLIYNKLK